MDDQAPPPPRYISLDALRGFAVMGILAMNIIAFSMPELAYINPGAWGGTSTPDIIAWALSFILVDGKMRGLFSLLFGASMVIIIRSAEAKATKATPVHLTRMFWLLVFGLLHYYLIWFGDILVLYAVIGSVAFLARRQPAEQLLRWAVLSFITSFTVWAIVAVSFVMAASAASGPGAEAGAVTAYREMIAGLGAPGSKQAIKEIAIYRSGYAEILAYRTGDGRYGPLMMILMSGLETFGLMLMGMALLKNGFLTGSWSPARYARTAGICYTIGLPPMALLGLWCISSRFDPIVTFNAVLAWSVPFRITLVIAHAAAAIWLIERWSGSAFIARVAAAGRAAFTNYLGTSLVMTTIFYGYGLGLYGHVPRAQVYLLAALGCGIMLLWSKPWLDRFAYGPLEWLWRTLARGRAQSMSKRVPRT